MKSKKKIITLMLIMMMVTVNLVGCGSTEVTAASLKKGFLAPYV